MATDTLASNTIGRPEDGFSRPLLPLRNAVLFPGHLIAIHAGRAQSVRAVEAALSRDCQLLVVGQRDGATEEPTADGLYAFGTLAEITSIDQPAEGGVNVTLEGRRRVRIVELLNDGAHLSARVEPVAETFDGNRAEADALVDYVHDLVRRHQSSCADFPADLYELMVTVTHPTLLSDLLAMHLVESPHERQCFLENLDPLNRLELLAARLTNDLDNSVLDQRIKERVRQQMDRNQREYYLREQLKAIRDELDGGESELDGLRERVRQRNLPAEVARKALKEIDRLERLPGVSSEGTVVRNYVETLLEIPWYEETVDRLDLDHAEAVLEHDHFGLEPVKARILEFLAVRKLTAGQEGAGATILCLAGPPGVGKTSLAQSIARAMGRRFERVSLGGVHDESEIRGHRRTYVGAMPGRIIEAVRRAGSSNPVILLDEIDKLGASQQGDPASALLEVLDPAQNHGYRDHYLDLPYDLSRVVFIATANYLANIPRPLRDRMEIIEVGGYTDEEKVAIGRQHLLPRQAEAHGLASEQIEVSDAAWRQLIRGYTREAGVRDLERQVAALCRRVAREVASGRGEVGVQITPERLEQDLGQPRFGYDFQPRSSQIGLVTGLGTTEVGGEIIPVEVAVVPGRGALLVTGQAGDVMQESARAALTFVRSRAALLGIPGDFLERCDLHIHLPEGAVPKDGPSAGITMATALVSALTGRPVRADVAMTGEITLRGQVLPIGGLRDKALAAHRVGIRRLIAPRENRRDAERIPANVATELEFIWVDSTEQVLAAALEGGMPVVSGVAEPQSLLMLDAPFGEPAAARSGVA